MLLESPYFDPCEQLVQDIMHVFLEGILCEIRLLLNYCINEIKVFKLIDLNSRIQGFPYGFSNSKIKQQLFWIRVYNKGLLQIRDKVPLICGFFVVYCLLFSLNL